jgi:hypothetical protein
MFFQMFWVKICLVQKLKISANHQLAFNYLSEISGDTIGTVIVFDKDNIDKVVDEYRIAEKAQTTPSLIASTACFKYSVGNTITSPPMTSAAQYVFSDVLGKNLSSAKIKDFCKSSISILSEGTSDSQLQ